MWMCWVKLPIILFHIFVVYFSPRSNLGSYKFFGVVYKRFTHEKIVCCTTYWHQSKVFWIYYDLAVGDILPTELFLKLHRFGFKKLCFAIFKMKPIIFGRNSIKYWRWIIQMWWSNCLERPFTQLQVLVVTTPTSNR